MAAELTYPEAGATRAAVMPAGYSHLERVDRLGTGAEVFERAVAALFGWRMQAGAGLTVVRSDGPAADGVEVVVRAGWGPLGVTIPCRVVYVVDEPGRRGFAYGTLPGHPVSGEEAFVVEAAGDGEVRLRIRAFSRPATLLTRAGGPVGRLVQRYATGRYVAALRRLAA